ncbi:MAG: hypothetical protein LBR92_02970 [Puniceicoccales bacterium]|jgi:hypothetical protein|nr:hypothetical protein [Puniceicoccales bacterium]
MDDSSQLWMPEDEKSIQDGIKKWKRLLQRALEENPVKIEKYVKVAMEVVDIAAQTFGRKISTDEHEAFKLGLRRELASKIGKANTFPPLTPRQEKLQDESRECMGQVFNRCRAVSQMCSKII